MEEESEVLAGSVLVNGIGDVNYREEDVVEERLESGNRSTSNGEQGRESVCCSDAESKDLSVLH